jgi:hypothetical protein
MIKKAMTPNTVTFLRRMNVIPESTAQNKTVLIRYVTGTINVLPAFTPLAPIRPIKKPPKIP